MNSEMTDEKLREQLGDIILGYAHAKKQNLSSAQDEAMQLITSQKAIWEKENQKEVLRLRIKYLTAEIRRRKVYLGGNEDARPLVKLKARLRKQLAQLSREDVKES